MTCGGDSRNLNGQENVNAQYEYVQDPNFSLIYAAFPVPSALRLAITRQFPPHNPSNSKPLIRYHIGEPFATNRDVSFWKTALSLPSRWSDMLVKLRPRLAHLQMQTMKPLCTEPAFACLLATSLSLRPQH